LSAGNCPSICQPVPAALHLLFRAGAMASPPNVCIRHVLVRNASSHGRRRGWFSARLVAMAKPGERTAAAVRAPPAATPAATDKQIVRICRRRWPQVPMRRGAVERQQLSSAPVPAGSAHQPCGFPINTLHPETRLVREVHPCDNGRRHTSVREGAPPSWRRPAGEGAPDEEGSGRTSRAASPS
jgi:hypothetical protein